MNLVNINTIENFTNETILSKAHASLVRIKTLNKSSIAIAFLDVIQQINIIYCRHIYHKVNGGVKRYFDMNVFRDKSERGAQTEMARMKRGVCRYIKLVREFGVNIIYLPQIFNPYNLREVSNKEYSMKIFVSNFYFLYLFRWPVSPLKLLLLPLTRWNSSGGSSLFVLILMVHL